jgi:hypothetical protein
MITWNLNEKQADYILQCLAARPFSEVHLLIQDLLNQVNRKPQPENTPN